MKKKLKTVALMLALVLPFSLLAQNGVFQRGDIGGQNGTSNQSMLLRNGETSTTLSNHGFGNAQGNLTNQGFGGANGGITNQTFGAPIGSGLFVLLVAGAGYATFKIKKRKSNH